MSDKNKLMRMIHAYDFTILELGLFLDTHADDARALKSRQQAQLKRAELVREYEEKYGPYILTSDDVMGDRWSWIDNPWPWDYRRED
ncbi:MAG: spore coat protein CotJB [Clostridiales bacterium]|jgi:spore coat protein JB|nr:spore coat protein CotJB [Clostridiales bacterium]